MKKPIILVIILFAFIELNAQWIKQTSGIFHDLYSVYFTDPSTGWAVGAYGTIIKTTNGGNNWSVPYFNQGSAGAPYKFVLNDFTNLRDDELSLLIKLKYDKYIEYCKHGEMCVLCNKPKVDN